jgi:hypothetical protein
MTTAFTRSGFTRASGVPQLPTMPTGWPIGSYGSYEDAQRAVDHLAGNDFPVTDVTIVGVAPMLVERVAGRISWRRVLTSAAMSGAWFGLFMGLLLSMFSQGAGALPIVLGLVAGIGFSVLFSAIGYGASRGRRRGFFTQSQLVAERYDVLSQPRNAEKGRDLLAKLALKSSQAFG